MPNTASLETDVVVVRGMRLMLEAGVDLSRQIWLDAPGYVDFGLLASTVHETRYRWRVRFASAEAAQAARQDRVLMGRIAALVTDCMAEPLVWSIFEEVATGDCMDERPRPPARNGVPRRLRAGVR